MQSSSFLRAASAKDPQPNATLIDDPSGLRMLLIEENQVHCPDNSLGQSLVDSPMLAFSLVMDAARSVAATSSLSCRGCSRPPDVESKDYVSKDISNANQKLVRPSNCRCCKVALLIPGETKQSRKRRRRSKNDECFASQVVGPVGKMEYPLNCKPENNATSLFSSTFNGGAAQWEDSILNQIHIKYVNSLADLIGYLAYAPSLPTRLQPLGGIFVIGLGDLLSRENQTSGIMEMTHALSVLSDTGKELEVNRRKFLKALDTGSESITLIATLSQQTYQSLPKRISVHFYQWIDYMAEITSVKSSDSSDKNPNGSSLWELAVTTLNQFDTSKDKKEKLTSSNSFRVIHSFNNNHESIHEIVWNA
ncbi:hypothetical protein HJC23_007601 [Cyclotella cryptica]|uniref:Uncharacterized protein n=1 Tax=Cyclotella cryptica TaxID=29204 RepID=A0ABD3QQY2_9STRA|eukprot:CCRYP_002893-RA/>CCRYP_002893-RA protein AED:0.02 eAED:0.02 QI:198/1/1/1/1/1/2/1130/363